MLSVLDLSIKSTIRLSISKHKFKQCEEIKLFGSAFAMKIKGKLRLLTADHVVHYDDYQEGKRIEQEDQVFLETNMTKGLSQLCYRLGNFQHFNIIDIIKYDISKPEIEYTEFIDFSYYTFSEKDDKSISIVPATQNDNIIILDETIPNGFGKQDLCIISGFINREIDARNILIKGELHSYKDLSYVSEKNGIYTLEYPDEIIYDSWKGLSGAPVFSDQGALVGMLLEVNETNNTVEVLSMKKIFELVK